MNAVHEVNLNIEDFSLQKRIGHGKYSHVFLGHHKSGKKVVIKVLRPTKPHRILREIRMLENIRGSPNTSQLIGVVKDKNDNIYALVMEWADNTVPRVLATRLSAEDIMGYARDILVSLRSIHSRGIMHRDVKPGNIAYDVKNKKACLIDWGFADFYDPEVAYNVRVSTRGYRSPEIIMGYSHYDVKVDIWALGCTIASYTFRRLPFFTGTSEAEQLFAIAKVFGGKEIMEMARKYKIELEPNLQTKIMQSTSVELASFLPSDRSEDEFEDILRLIKRMLTIDIQERPSADTLLNEFDYPK